MNSSEGFFSLILNKTFNTSSSSEGRQPPPPRTWTEDLSPVTVWSNITTVEAEVHQIKTYNFHQILTEEMKTISLPCLLVSVPIIILCMLVCELLYKTVMNNVVPGLFRHCQSRKKNQNMKLYVDAKL